MKPWLWRTALCLFLGAMTTVAVAWCIAVVGSDQRSLWQGIYYERIENTFIRMERFDRAGARGTRISSDVTRQRSSAVIDDDELQELFNRLNGRMTTRMDYEYGWPYFALHMGFEDDFDKATRKTWGALQLYPAMPIGVQALPVGIIPAGFVLNSALFGAVWLVPLSARPLVEWRRRCRGRCPKCAYDLRGQVTAGCPECGWNRGEEGTEARRHEVMRE